MLQNKNTEQGNVLIIILVAVALFGALIFTFSRSGSQGVSSINKQEAKIAAQEILNYARLVEGAVDRVRRNGCSESEISFENAVVAGYSNPNSPGDKSCHIFDDEGGKVAWSNLPDKFKADGSLENWNVYTIQNRESSNNTIDLAVMAPYIKQNICIEINSLLGNSQMLKDAGNASTTFKFTGDLSLPNSIRDFGTNFFNIKSFCFEGDLNPPGAGTYHFVHTILHR